jgi:nitronate monooxygenase
MNHDLPRLLGIRHPLIQAPMATAATPALVAAVSEAGALGSLACGYLEPEAIARSASEIRALTSRPFALNMFVLPDAFVVDETKVAASRAWLDELARESALEVPGALPARWAPRCSEQLAALHEARPAVASFAFGVLEAAQVAGLQRAGIRVIGTATTVDEALAWEAAGADAVAMQGAEAGGHRGGFLHDFDESMIGLFALLPQAARAVRIPLIAAGGIMDGRAMAAAELLGASASQLGTAFLTCTESGATPGWKRDLAAAHDHSTVVTRGFSGRPARGLVNTFTRAVAPRQGDFPDYPAQNALTGALRRAAAQAGRSDLISEWAGQAASLVRPMPAGELVAILAAEREAALEAR